MQMAISTTGRRPLCIFCSVSVLSKMLKLRSAEGSSFRLWWLLSVFCCWSSVLVLVECCQPFVAETALLWWDQMLVAESHHCARHQTHWVLGSAGPSRSGSLQQCWVFWGETFQMVNMQWLEPSVSVLVVVHQMSVSEGDHCWVWHSDLSHWSHCQKVGVWVGPRVSEDLCLNAVGHCEFSSILLALCVAKVTLIGNVAA
jgi:hypothetical protein